MKTDDKATLALLGTVTLWSVMTVVARDVVSSVNQLTVLFYRLLIAAVCFLPLFLRLRPYKKPRFWGLAAVSLRRGHKAALAASRPA